MSSYAVISKKLHRTRPEADHTARFVRGREQVRRIVGGISPQEDFGGLHVLPGQNHRCDQMRPPGAGNCRAECSTIESVIADATAFLVPNPRKSAARKPVGRFGRFTGKWRAWEQEHREDLHLPTPREHHPFCRGMT